MVDRWPWRMLCLRDRIVWWMLCHRVLWWMLCHLWLLRVWRMLCRYYFTLADALPPWPRYSVDASPPSRGSCLFSLGIFGDRFLCRSCSSDGFCVGWLVWRVLPSVLLLLSICCVSGYGRLCVCLYFFFSVSLSLVFCVLVLVNLCLAASKLCL